MPLTIGAVALLGWWAGLAPAAALLLGAVLAPTDPVLASDVQVQPDRETGDRGVEETDEVRFTLTSEAGLNDGLAFPFVYGAILLATEGAVSGWALEWLGTYSRVAELHDRSAGRHRGRQRAGAHRVPINPALRWPRQENHCWLLRPWWRRPGVGEVIGGYGFL